MRVNRIDKLCRAEAIGCLFMDKDFQKLLELAKSKSENKSVSPFMETGKVLCAIMTDKNNMYYAVNINSSCDMGFCAERNAAGTMLSNGESKIIKMVCLHRNGSLILPCGSCREFLMQLHEDSKDMSILTSLDGDTITLGSLLPNWWGTERFEAFRQGIIIESAHSRRHVSIKSKNGKLY